MKKGLKKENRIYIILMAGLVLLAIGNFVLNAARETELAEPLVRGEYGEKDRLLSAVAEAEYQGKTVRHQLELKVKAKELSPEEKERRLEICKDSLDQVILGGNESLQKITEDLNLIVYQKETGVELHWESDKPELINEKGEVFPGNRKEDVYVQLTAALYLDGVQGEWKCNVRHAVFLNDENYRKLLERDLSLLEEKMSLDAAGDQLTLPEHLENGTALRWLQPEDNTLLLWGALLGILMLSIDSNRRTRKKRLREQRQQEIEGEFPYFLDKLVMYLSAGLILREAVERIALDYRNFSGSQKKVFFMKNWGSLYKICVKAIWRSPKC